MLILYTLFCDKADDLLGYKFVSLSMESGRKLLRLKGLISSLSVFGAW